MAYFDVPSIEKCSRSRNIAGGQLWNRT